MVRNYVRKTAPYDKGDMEKAVNLVLGGTIGYKKAASMFSLKWETVRDHVKARYKKMGAGRPTALTEAEETELAECLKMLAEWGFGMTRKETQEVVGEYICTLGRKSPFVDDLPGCDWLSAFMKRHPELSHRLPEQLKKARAHSAANKTVFDSWFRLLEKTLKDNDLLNKPDRIYNVDESGFPLDPKRLKVICKKGADHLFRVIGGSGRETITVNGCGRADGVMLPPYILYAAKNLRTKWTENGPDNARYNVSDKGWMDTVCFHDWFKCQFIPYLPPGRPVILIFDGHASRLNIATIREAIKNQVIILNLPSNSTHVLQPLDVGVYGPVKTAWEAILIKFARQNLGTPLNKELFPSLLAQVWKSDSLSEDNVKAGFRRCGIMPFDHTQIPEEIYKSAEIFDRPLPSSTVRAEQSQLTNALDLAGFSDRCKKLSSSLDLAGDPLMKLPASAHNSPTSSRPVTPTLKEFFLTRLTPMLDKPKKTVANRQKAVQRLYGESLTSAECVQRLEEEAAAKESKRARPGRGKGKQPAKRAAREAETAGAPSGSKSLPVAPVPVLPASISDSSDFSDSDSDPEWTPLRGKTSNYRNVFDTFS